MKFVVVPVNPNTQVILLYERNPPVIESEVRFILLLNVLQSDAESAPTVELLARERERTCPESESPFGELKVRGTCVCDWRNATCPESEVMSVLF